MFSYSGGVFGALEPDGPVYRLLPYKCVVTGHQLSSHFRVDQMLPRVTNYKIGVLYGIPNELKFFNFSRVSKFKIIESQLYILNN